MYSQITDIVLAVSHSDEIAIPIKATMVLLIGLIAAGLAVRAKASWRHLIFTTTMAVVLLLPIIAAILPGLTLDVPVETSAVYVERSIESQTATSSESINATSQRPAVPSVGWSLPNLQTVLLVAWFVGCLLFVAAFARDLWMARILRRNGLPAARLQELTRKRAAKTGIKRSIDVLVHEDIGAPVTYGFLRPVILFPENAAGWKEEDLERAIVHELEHVRRGDWVTQLLARTVCVFYWFHPLVWITWRRLCIEAERACDDAVVQDAGHEDYAEQLVTLSQNLKDLPIKPLLGMAKRSDLSRRVDALLDDRQRRGRSGLLAVVFAVAFGGFAVVSIGPLRAVAKSISSQALNQIDASDCSTPIRRALIEAVREGKVEEIKTLLGAGVDVNCKLDGDGSPLIEAAKNGRLTVVKLLLDRGADVNMGVKGDGNPLIIAAKDGKSK